MRARDLVGDAGGAVVAAIVDQRNREIRTPRCANTEGTVCARTLCSFRAGTTA